MLGHIIIVYQLVFSQAIKGDHVNDYYYEGCD